ncbi:MAG TPA: hypothetical protein VFP12_15270 [Allosphingosinicella sp.]|nr:hypothetical protein [Allosphingosinicella sp.]
MPTTFFDWIARTAMLAMAGLVTLSILGAIAAMTNDPGPGIAAGDRPRIEAERAGDREKEQAQPNPQDGNATAAAPGDGRGTAAAAAPPAAEDRQARWLEAIAYALLAIAGVGALGVLMLWSVVRELRRIGGAPR